MKAALVAQNSSYSHTNLAVRVLQARLVKDGINAVIAEDTVNEHGINYKLLDRIYALDADVCLFSAYIWNLKEQLLLAECVKELLPDVRIVFGGPEVSFENRDFFERYPFVDCIIQGEGESVVYDCVTGRISDRIVKASACQDFEDAPEPYISSPYREKEALENKLVYYESSRGCPFSCSYCLSSNHYDGRKIRAKSAQVAIKELTALGDTKAKAIKLVDRTFNFDVKRAKEIFKALVEYSADRTQNGVYSGPVYHFEICADLIDDETVSALKSAPENLFRFEIGIQSTNQKVLGSINRKSDVSKSLEKIRQLRENTSVTLHLDLIAGLPFMTEEIIKKDFNAIYPYGDMIQLGVLKLLKGTELRQRACDFGIKFCPEPPYRVLQTDCLSYDALQRVCGVAKVYESIGERDSGYYNTIKYVSEHFSDMYSVFCSIYDKIKDNAVSRKNMYHLLCEYFSEMFDRELIKSYLRFDYYLSNQGRAMDFLRSEKSDFEENLPGIRKTAFSLLEKGNDISYTSGEVRYFEFDRDYLYVIDRRTKRYERIAKSLFNDLLEY